MPVAPFGRPIDMSAWDSFRSRTGLPVVIDAAAGFDSLTPGATPAVVSLHATKVLAVGEGGFLISTDASIVRNVRTRSNFGFESSRIAQVAAANAKLSEYHAAVGHAALDEWADTRAEWMAAAGVYRRLLADLDQIHFQEGFGRAWIASTCVLNLPSSAARTESTLANAGIDTRRWWGDGAHAHPATAALPRARLPATEALAQSTLSVPFYRDLGDEEIGRVAELVLAAAGS
jgi:dTDP-4-amino-4,6-dideoxygalactose transaminase